MLLSTHGIIASGNNYSEEYDDILGYASSQGFALPSIEQQRIQNALVESLISYGIWDLLDVFYVFANDGGAAFGRINWKAPANYYATPYGNPTFISNQGYQGSVSTQGHLTTGFNVAKPGGKFQASNASLFVYVYDNIAHNTYGDIGIVSAEYGTGTQYGAINSRMPAVGALNSRAEYNLLDNNTFPFNTSDVPTSVGFSHVDRANSSQIKFYKNGILYNTQSATQVAITQDLELNFLRGIQDADYSDRKVSIGGVGASLADKASAFASVVSSYMSLI